MPKQGRERRIRKALLPNDAPTDLLGGRRALRRVLGNARGLYKELIVIESLYP